ncbi:hypothetical protein CHS0354_011221 [Potamilus streckersoni]|uniref:Voltage-gated hydrogen channel 1 n=1 Tax=Potamilus streckersoni TaxID=2493646 RepID=A0AAE0RNF0_9BIVA|nr:hypothetical protein CHS0354_011221 [Potamilus streckersoni]
MEELRKLHDDSEKVDENKDLTSSVNSDCEETKREFTSFRERLNFILHSHKFQIIVICIVIIDCLLVVAGLLFDLEIIKTSEHSEVPHILHYGSIGILGLFILELFARVYAIRLEFFRHKVEIFDAIVIIVSFILDLVFINAKGPESGVGLLIVLRLWRVIRILNGIVMSVKKEADDKLNKERKRRKEYEQEVTKYRGYYLAQQKEIKTLRSLLCEHGITDIVPSELSKSASNVDVVAEVNQLPEETVVNESETNEKKQEVPSAAAV